jgi:hypothetical protein
MTEAKIDQTKTVPDGGYVCAKMAFENGKIWIEAPYSKGTTFVIQLPMGTTASSLGENSQLEQ